MTDYSCTPARRILLLLLLYATTTLLYDDYTRTYSHFSYINMTSTAVLLRVPSLPLTTVVLYLRLLPLLVAMCGA